MAADPVGEVSLPTDTEILITRMFDVPKQLIYRAWTTPELVRRWWGGERGAVIDELRGPEGSCDATGDLFDERVARRVHRWTRWLDRLGCA
jgi:uncharacterized protein YndB with AHSA1/START domain